MAIDLDSSAVEYSKAACMFATLIRFSLNKINFYTNEYIVQEHPGPPVLLCVDGPPERLYEREQRPSDLS